MKATALLRERHQLSEGSFVELVVWSVPEPKRGSSHSFKYRLAYVVSDQCVVRYDNEAGKGDHVHHGGAEAPYRFTTPEKLLSDFWRDVDRWKQN